jgi:hypothetical protein
VDPDDELKPVPTATRLGGHVLKAFLQVNSVIGGGIAVIVGIVVSAYAPASVIPMWLAVGGGFTLLWAALTFLGAAVNAVTEARTISDAATAERKRYEREVAARRDEEKRSAAIVVAAVKPYIPYQKASCVMIVKWPQASGLPMGAQVIVALAEETHERPLGTGFVRPAQQDGKHVITLDTPFEGTKDAILDLLSPKTTESMVGKIRIGPWFEMNAPIEQKDTSSEGETFEANPDPIPAGEKQSKKDGG